jgi:intracellular septation protein
MTALLEFSPLLAFGLAYYLGGMYTATGTLMVAMTALLFIARFRTGRFPPMHTASTALVLVLGTATLILRNAKFIQWKPSVLLWLVAVAFLVSSFVGKQPLAQRALQSALGDQVVDRRMWLKVNAAFVAFCAVAGIANILVAYRMSEAAWANFKVFGLTAGTFVFLLTQVLWLNSRAQPTQNPPTHE